MRMVKVEMIGLTEEEFRILDKAWVLLDNIHIAADSNGGIANASCQGMESIGYLLENYKICEVKNENY